MDGKSPPSQQASTLAPINQIYRAIRYDIHQYSIQELPVTSRTTLIDSPRFGLHHQETSYGQETRRYGLKDMVQFTLS